MSSKRDGVQLERLNQQQAALLIGVTSRTLRDWADAPRNRDGTYHGPDLVQWLIARRGADAEFDDQRQRLAAAQAEKVEHENALRRGEMARMQDVERHWSGAIGAARAKILGVPTKLGPQLVNIGDANLIVSAIRAELHAALAELAGYEPPLEPEQCGAGDSEGVSVVGAASDIDGERVGGSRAAAVRRKRRGAGAVED